MNKKISLGWTVALIILSVALTLSVTFIIAMRQFDYKMYSVNQRQAMFKYITEVDKAVRQHYSGDIDEEVLRSSLTKGYLEGISDKYSSYLSAEEYGKETERLSGKWTGLGLDVNQDKTLIIVSKVNKNSAAEKAGIQKGDVITNIDGKTTSTMNIEEIRAVANGSNKAMITVSRGSQSIAFEISPSTYVVNSVESRMIDSTGYIRITDFFSNTPEQFKEAYTNLEAQGAQNYIFDVRFNEGGSIDAASAVIGYLIPRGTFAYRTDKQGNVTDLVSKGTYSITKPSVTLVNEKTAAEAELFAGVLQYFNKTTVVGVQSAGHGLIQEFFNVNSDGAAIKISVASLSLVDGKTVEGEGVQPSITVGMTSQQEENFAFLNEKTDPQLMAGIVSFSGSISDNSDDTSTGSGDASTAETTGSTGTQSSNNSTEQAQ